jgi:hypothetical protein
MVLEKNVKNKMDRQNNGRLSFSKGERRKFTFINLKNSTPLIDRAYNWA